MPEILFKELSFAILGAAMEVHTVLGSGFLEAVYLHALMRELTLRGLSFEVHKKLPVSYKGLVIGDYETDLIVEGKIILELKAVSAIHPRHEAQALHYLAATGLTLAIILNFGADKLQQKRVARSLK